KRLNAVKTARVASLSGLKTLSFPHTARSYETLCLLDITTRRTGITYWSKNKSVSLSTDKIFNVEALENLMQIISNGGAP
ncbi:hypothetical protein MEN41_16130, partial [Dolichospermum sp. ST_con]|nr:hypothetical protein [Dolichospermum sp. ST_con]